MKAPTKPAAVTKTRRNVKIPVKPAAVTKTIRRRLGQVRAVPIAAVGAALLLLLAVALIVAVWRSRPENQTIPADPKARSEFVAAQSAKLSESDRRALARFLERMGTQEAAGGATPKVTLGKAIEQQRTYDQQIIQMQAQYKERLDAAKAALHVEVREQGLVKAVPKSASGKSLRYVIDVANRGERAVDTVTLRVELRDASRNYLAVNPSLELKGPLRAGESGRSVQTLPLNPQYHQYILDGGQVQILVYPMQITYADGEKLDVGQELKALESVSRAKIE